MGLPVVISSVVTAAAVRHDMGVQCGISSNPLWESGSVIAAATRSAGQSSGAEIIVPQASSVTINPSAAWVTVPTSALIQVR